MTPHGFGWPAWLHARKRVSRTKKTARDRFHAGADERAANAALRPSTGNVAPFPAQPPSRRKR